MEIATMKRIISALIMTAMFFSLVICITAFPASADEGGDWVVYTSPMKYLIKGEESTDPQAPIPGYGYTDEGFVVKPTEFTGANTPFFNVMTKEPQYLKDGISLKVRVDTFPYSSDCWFSFCIWSDHNIPQGITNDDYGNGWYDLIRFNVDRFGRKTLKYMQSFLQNLNYYNSAIGPSSTEEGGTVSAYIDQGDPSQASTYRTDEEGRVYLDMQITYDAEVDQYRLYVCGAEVRNDIMDDYIKKTFPDGYAYIGIGAHDAGNGTAGITLTEYNGIVPTGTDAAEEYKYERNFGPMIDSSEIPDDEPALLLNALNEKGDYKVNEKGIHVGGLYLDFSFDGDRIHAITDQVGPKTLLVSPRDEVSYEASDFPVVAMLLRDYCACVLNPGDSCYDKVEVPGGDYINWEYEEGERFSLYYCAGDTLNPDDDHLETIDYSWLGTWNGVDGHEYKLVLLDLSDKGEEWQGRINLIQFCFDTMQMANDSQRQMDICYVGFFKTVEAAENYAIDYAGIFEPEESDTLTESDTATETEPVPTETEPVPTETEPVPTETEPVPTETEPVPTETEPVPTETEPVPTETEPVPTETEPVPTETESAPAQTESPTASDKETDTPAVESKPADTKPAGDDGKDEGGCGSVVGLGAIAIVISIVASGAVITKKNRA